MPALRHRWPWAISAILCTAFAAVPASAKTIKVLFMGLGNGAVQSGDGLVDCTSADPTCLGTYTSPYYGPVLLTAEPDDNSIFVGWEGDCSGNGNCTVWNHQNRFVRAVFRRKNEVPLTAADVNPTGLAYFLSINPDVTTPARFLRALPSEYKQGWILMTRSESLQTGTARFPRVMLPSADARNVFTIGIAAHASYPGAHPNAIEYMQWDPAEKNFRFHEIVLDTIPAVTATRPNGTTIQTFPLRLRGIRLDEPRCTRCHSTRNVPNPNVAHLGTTGSPPGSVPAKNKPNWDAYDSWGGAMPFNRDRIYQGSLEAAAFRRVLNPWTWLNDRPTRQVMEQLELQPPQVPSQDFITRQQGGGLDGQPLFPFDNGVPVQTEPAPVGQPYGGNAATETSNYSFNSQPGPASTVQRHGNFVTLHAADTPYSPEGRGVQLFDLLGGLDGSLNQTRIGNELANHSFATGSLPMDIRPVALAINKQCLATDAINNRVVSTVSMKPVTFDQNFFRERNSGLGVNEITTDTYTRAKELPRRKADIQKLNLDRDGDNYLLGSAPSIPEIDLLSEYGAATAGGATSSLPRLRQEVLRRPIDAGSADQSTMGGGLYVDRETHGSNYPLIGLYRFLLEPLGVPVDKWSMSVRGRSRSYTFADVFGTYVGPIRDEITASFATRPYTGNVQLDPNDCGSLIDATNEVLASLPATNAVPPYTDVQRVFNKGCIECHGGLYYPPFSKFPVDLDISEDDAPASGNRLQRSYDRAVALINGVLTTSKIWSRINLTSEACPYGMMPCGGPALSQADVHTIKRWIQGGTPSSSGDPHLATMDGTRYDFQSAGEFTLLRGESFELQARHTPVQADGPLPPDGHTGLSSCPSISTAAALRVGPHRVTYQPNPSASSGPDGMQLRVDGKLIEKLDATGYALSNGGRILPAPGGGIQIEYAGGTDVVITPGWWNYYQLWYLNIDVRKSRAIFGLLGQIQPGNWLPAMPNGLQSGARPASLQDRYDQLYGKFADAWRVTKSGSLFDYAPGTSTATYTLEDWPQQEPSVCKLPDGWAPKLPPQKPIEADIAKKQCAVIADKGLRANCATDVMRTGELGFVATYLATDRLRGNKPPREPSLVSPKADELDLSDSVSFAWEQTADPDGGALTYLHCVWPIGDTQTLNHCRQIRDGNMASISGLESNRAYYWKVVVTDGQGATIESELRRFMTK